MPAASAPGNLQTRENDLTPTEHSFTSKAKSASALATRTKEFKDWAFSVKLDQTIYTPVLENLPNLNTPADHLNSIKVASNRVPAWLPTPDCWQFQHISTAHNSLKNTLCTLLTGAIDANIIQLHSETDFELHSSINTIFQTCLHQITLNEEHENPTEMDRRTCIDHLIAHIFESNGIKTLKYGTEQKIKLPKAQGFKVATTTADGVIYMDVSRFQPYRTAGFRDFASAFVPRPKCLKVIHCVAEYKKEGSGKNQALMGIVSGLYQRRILRKDHQLVFAVFHDDIDVLRVVAGGWQNGQIHVYQVGNYSLQNPLQAVKFYLVIRRIREIGQQYLEELRQSEFQLEFDLVQQPPVDEWAKEDKESTSEDLNEPDGNGPNEQPGWTHQLSALGQWDSRSRIFAYLDSMSNNDSSSSSEESNDPQSPPPYTAVGPSNLGESVSPATQKGADSTERMDNHGPMNSSTWHHVS